MILQYQCQSRHNSILNPSHYDRRGIRLVSSTIVQYQRQFGLNFICISTLLSMSIKTPLYLYQYFTINVNQDTTLSVPVLYNQCQLGHNFICTSTLLSMSIRTQLYLYQYFTINDNQNTTLSVPILYYQCQFGHHFICIKTLLSMSIRTQLYQSQSISIFQLITRQLFSLNLISKL